MKVIYYGLAAIGISFGAGAECRLTATQNSIYLGEHDIGTLSQQPTLLHSTPLQYQLNCDAPVRLQGFTLRENRSQAEHRGGETPPSSYLNLSIDELRSDDGERIAFSLSPEDPSQTRLSNYPLPANSETLRIFTPNAASGRHFTLSLTVANFAAPATQLRKQSRDLIPLSTQLQVSADYVEQ
ncbi:hypothetical protein D3C79_478380 [compost metagenome]